MKELQIELKRLQEQVIGMFHPNFYPPNEWVCVVKYDNGNLECVEIGSLFGLQTLFIHQSQGTYRGFYKKAPEKLMPVAKTLAQMMENPFDLDDWWKNNISSPK
jgi:hypothetical protein